MKKFFVRLIVLFLLVLTVDCFVGYAIEYFQKNAIGGDNGRNNYICNTTSEDILIFGSSRASHHYVPMIIEDSLNMSCYNCGQDGNGIILSYARYRMISERYTPKFIIYDVAFSFDLQKNDNRKYLSWLRPYYKRNGVDSIFWSVDHLERYKMYSNMYQYNSNFVQIISDSFIPQQSDIKGYRPLYGTMDYEPITKSSNSDNTMKYDSLKLYYFEKLIKECLGKTKLIFFLSPYYINTDLSTYKPIIDLCIKYNIPFINHLNDKDFIGNKDYFEDSTHLNNKGAEYYTKKIISEIRKYI